MLSAQQLSDQLLLRVQAVAATLQADTDRWELGQSQREADRYSLEPFAAEIEAILRAQRDMLTSTLESMRRELREEPHATFHDA